MEQMMEYQKTYIEYKAELDNELAKTAEGFVRIGYLLKVARDTDILRESGYSTVTEFAKAEYGIDKTQVSRFIRINDKFSEGGYSDHLLPQYQGFGYAKLSLMMLIPDEINEELTPDYSKAEIQAIKEEVEAEEKISDIEVMLEEPPEDRSLNLITQVMRRVLEENPEKYKEIHETFCIEKTTDDLQSILAPNGDKVYTVRIPGTGRIMLIISDKDPDVVLVNMRQNNEKTRHPWSEVLQVTSWLIKTELSVEDSWRQQFDSEFPIKAQVAPVQPKKEPRKESKVSKAKIEKPKENPKKADIPKETPKEEPKKEPAKQEIAEEVHSQEAGAEPETQSQKSPAEPEKETIEQPIEQTEEKDKETPSETSAGQQDENPADSVNTESPDDLPVEEKALEETQKEERTEGPKEDPKIIEKVEGTPLYVRRKYMSRLSDEELAEYLKKELKPHIMLSEESILRWLQEEV